MMKRLFAIAAFVLASTAAQAQYTFDYGGRTIHIDPDRGTVSIPGVYDNSGRRTKRSRNDDSDRHSRKPASDQAKVDPQAPATAPGDPSSAPANTAPDSSTATANVGPADNATSQPPASTTAAPPDQPDSGPAARPEPPPVVAAVPPPAPAPRVPAPAIQAAVPSPNSPLGLWLTEEKEGKVRIEQCGANLCGYSVDARSNQNGEQVLINMKPGKDSKWSGRILDPKSGSTYDSTIALKGTDTLRVQGCAFNGMFCGGQTWSRLN
jgi:Uncharacterized protein conserved in bacteria (DUF2147)